MTRRTLLAKMLLRAMVQTMAREDIEFDIENNDITFADGTVVTWRTEDKTVHFDWIKIVKDCEKRTKSDASDKTSKTRKLHVHLLPVESAGNPYELMVIFMFCATSMGDRGQTNSASGSQRTAGGEPVQKGQDDRRDKETS